MRQGHALSAEEQAHVDGCEECTDACLDAAVVTALETKPEVRVPEGFAAKVVERLPEKSLRIRTRRYAPSWGLVTATVLVAVGLVVVVTGDPGLMRTRMGLIFEGLVAAEVAGIALWLALVREMKGR
jgi:hypothetical protein